MSGQKLLLHLYKMSLLAFGFVSQNEPGQSAVEKFQDFAVKSYHIKPTSVTTGFADIQPPLEIYRCAK